MNIFNNLNNLFLASDIDLVDINILGVRKVAISLVPRDDEVPELNQTFILGKTLIVDKLIYKLINGIKINSIVINCIKTSSC